MTKQTPIFLITLLLCAIACNKSTVAQKEDKSASASFTVDISLEDGVSSMSGLEQPMNITFIVHSTDKASNYAVNFSVNKTYEYSYKPLWDNRRITLPIDKVEEPGEYIIEGSVFNIEAPEQKVQFSHNARIKKTLITNIKHIIIVGDTGNYTFNEGDAQFYIGDDGYIDIEFEPINANSSISVLSSNNNIVTFYNEQSYYKENHFFVPFTVFDYGDVTVTINIDDNVDLAIKNTFKSIFPNGDDDPRNITCALWNDFFTLNNPSAKTQFLYYELDIPNKILAKEPLDVIFYIDGKEYLMLNNFVFNDTSRYGNHYLIHATPPVMNPGEHIASILLGKSEKKIVYAVKEFELHYYNPIIMLDNKELSVTERNAIIHNMPYSLKLSGVPENLLTRCFFTGDNGDIIEQTNDGWTFQRTNEHYYDGYLRLEISETGPNPLVYMYPLTTNIPE